MTKNYNYITLRNPWYISPAIITDWTSRIHLRLSSISAKTKLNFEFVLIDGWKMSSSWDHECTWEMAVSVSSMSLKANGLVPLYCFLQIQTSTSDISIINYWSFSSINFTWWTCLASLFKTDEMISSSCHTMKYDR